MEFTRWHYGACRAVFAEETRVGRIDPRPKLNVGHVDGGLYHERASTASCAQDCEDILECPLRLLLNRSADGLAGSWINR